MTIRPVISENAALVSVQYRLGQYQWLARGEYIKDRGFNVDIFRNGVRLASHDGLIPSGGEGNRDVMLVSSVLDQSIKDL